MEDNVLIVVNEMSSWCFKNHSVNFVCEFQFTGYVNWIEIKISSGSHDNPVKTIKTESCELTTDREYSFKYLSDFFQAMKEFKKEHDEWFTDENLKKQEEKKKKEKIQRLKKQLEHLEG